MKTVKKLWTKIIGLIKSFINYLFAEQVDGNSVIDVEYSIEEIMEQEVREMESNFKDKDMNLKLIDEQILIDSLSRIDVEKAKSIIEQNLEELKKDLKVEI